jgi:hypothetical protein
METDMRGLLVAFLLVGCAEDSLDDVAQPPEQQQQPRTNLPPVLGLETSLSVLESGQPVTLTGTASDPDGGVVDGVWDLGDGTAPRAFDAPGPDTINHVYVNTSAAPRTFTVTLTVLDDDGAETTATRQLEVARANVPPDYNGRWRWSLNAGEPVDPSGWGACPFSNSQLDVGIAGGGITITEMVGSSAMATYTGNYSDPSFTATHADSTYGTTETIAGRFTSPTTFTGTYTLYTGLFADCDTTRGVNGTKE